jgi:hypothetical protein
MMENHQVQGPLSPTSSTTAPMAHRYFYHNLILRIFLNIYLNIWS